MTKPKNGQYFSLLATFALLLLTIIFTAFQFVQSTNIHAQGSTLTIVQVKHTTTFTHDHGSQYKPQLRTTPDRQGAGSYFYLSGTGFLAHEQMSVYWQTSKKSIPLGQATADNTGGLFYAGFYTPKGLAPDNYTILLQRAKDVEPATLTVPFRILAPAMHVSHVPGNNQALLLHLTNFAAYETLIINWNAHGGQQLGNIAAHYNGEGYFSFVPSATPKGRYVVTVKGQESGLSVSGRISYP